MSAFLGPIHYWLYNKIQIEQQIVNDIIAYSKQNNIDLENELNERYGVAETRALEEVIDQTNIHAWLQNCVSKVEGKLAYSVTKILQKDAGAIKELQNIFEKKGMENQPEITNDATVIFKAINDSLLDGMPCDHANAILEESEEQVIWQRNNCVHKQFWNEVKGDVANYYMLREAFIKGFLNGTSFEFIKIDETTNQIRRV